MDSPGAKEWFKLTHSAKGDTVVTCTRQEGELTVKWSVKSYLGVENITKAVELARAQAQINMTVLRKAVS